MRSGILYSAIGLGVGTVLGWAITADIYEKRMREQRAIYDEMFKRKTEHIWALQDRLDNNKAPAFETVRVDVPVEEPVEEEVEEVHEPQETIEETRTNLQNLIDMYTADEASRAEFVEIASEAVSNENRMPYVITREQYAYDEDGQYYSKITVNYYPRDRVVLDDDEEPIENVASFIGWRNLSRFGDGSDDPDVVFVRNDKLETDFEVIKEEDSPLPLHVTYGMEREEFRANKAAGLIKLRQEDE